jgi:hypothetical protein
MRQKAGIGFKYSDLSEDEKLQFTKAKEEAEASGNDFVFKGHNFGKVTKSKSVPTPPVNDFKAAHDIYTEAKTAYDASIAEGSGKTAEEQEALRRNLEDARGLLKEESSKAGFGINAEDRTKLLTSMGIDPSGSYELTDEE